MAFASAADWERWLAEHHEDSPGVWVKIAKRGTGVETVSYPEVVETALCYGWIDGLRQKVDDVYFRQRVTSRGRRSKWSKINCEKAEALLAAGRMRPAGQREVERAKADGRWDAAYDGQRTIEVPDDLARALRGNAAAQRRSTVSTVATGTRCCSGSTTPSARRRAPSGSSSSSPCWRKGARFTDGRFSGSPLDPRRRPGRPRVDAR